LDIMFRSVSFWKLLLFPSKILLALSLVRPASSFVSNSRQTRHHFIAVEGSLIVFSKRSSNEKKSDETNDPTLPFDPSEVEEQPTLIETIGGGTSTIFEMARRMLVWNDEPTSENTNDGILPRWHPHSGISDVNPSFRTKAPAMSNTGYAGQIWRNVRKRNKPSLWRHALRTYDRMEETSRNNANSVLRIERSTSHHEGALLACAKLGLWKKSLELFQGVETVTDNMVLSVVKACVRASKTLKRENTTVEERKAPLDAAVNILEDVRADQDFPLMARHLNPLAAAYQSLGLVDEAKNIIQLYLTDRSLGPEPEYGSESFNVHDVSAKDKASYSLLVKGAVSSGNWSEAIEALEDMTEAGLYPNSRNLNSWSEVSERKTKHRRTRSWKKKRDEYWLESVN